MACELWHNSLTGRLYLLRIVMLGGLASLQTQCDEISNIGLSALGAVRTPVPFKLI